MTNDSHRDVDQIRRGSKARFVPDPQSGTNERPFILSYLGMRELAGWVGVALPFAVALGNWRCSGGLEGSISAYYFTRMGAWFAGSLWVIGFFMVSCRGYDKWDELSGRLAGCFALGVALLPMNIHEINHGWVQLRGWLHWTCAALLFIVFALTSLFLFTKSDKNNPTSKKRLRNGFYRGCGWAILICIALIGVYGLLKKFDLDLYKRIGQYEPVFWLEAGAVFSFGVSWLVKGESFSFLQRFRVGTTAWAPSAVHSQFGNSRTTQCSSVTYFRETSVDTGAGDFQLDVSAKSNFTIEGPT